MNIILLKKVIIYEKEVHVGKIAEETKEKLKNKNSGSNHIFYGKKGVLSHNYGRKHSEETKAKHRILSKGENNPMFGKKHSEETKAKQREVKLGEKSYNFGKKCPEHSLRISGENHPNAKIWKLTNIISGEIFGPIKHLKQYCKENNLNYSSLNMSYKRKSVYLNTWKLEIF